MKHSEIKKDMKVISAPMEFPSVPSIELRATASGSQSGTAAKGGTRVTITTSI